MVAIALMILTSAVLLLAISIFFLTSQASNLNAKMEKVHQELEYLGGKIDGRCDNIDYSITESMKGIKIDVLSLQALILRANDISPMSNKRKPRTKEQKAEASRLRKEWWAKKRQEQNTSIPDDESALK